MDDILLESFPFDSMDVLNEQSGQMEPDRLYAAAIFRRYFAKFLSNGVYFGNYKNYKENSMKVISDGGMNIKVLPGCGVIEGADYENEENRIFTIERPASGTRKDWVIVQLDTSLAVRQTKLYVKRGTGSTPPELQRDNNIYEICIAEVTSNSTSNISAEDIVDKRLDNTVCGIVDSLVTVDGEELYQRFQSYIDSVVDNLVRKDTPEIVLSGVLTDAHGGTSEENFTTNLKNKLDGIATEANKTEYIDNLSSDDTNKALSAKQGKVLKELIEAKQKKILYGTAVPSSSYGEDDDIYIQYF